MILVTGASGRTGSHVLSSLMERDAEVRALVPDPVDAAAVARAMGPGVDVAVADYEVPESLAAVVAGVEQVFLVAPGSPRLVEHEANVIEAAAGAGVRRVVKVSGLGAAADSPFSITRWHAESESRLSRSGMRWTVLRPNFFMQNFLFMFAPRIASEGAIYAPVGDGRISMLDCRDLAAVAVGVLTGSGHDGATYVVTGPQALNLSEAGQIVAGVIGRPVRHVDLPPEEALLDMVDHGVRRPFAEALLGLFSFFRAGGGAQVTDVVARVGGSAPREFARFAEEHAAELAG